MTPAEVALPKKAQPLDRSESSTGGASQRGRWRRTFGFRNASAVYVWVFLIILFSLWVPDTFLTTTTLKSVLSQQSVTTMIALGLVVALAAGVYDLSIGYTAGAAGVSLAWIMVDHGAGTWVSIAFALAIGLIVGFLNGMFVARAKINSFIATLAMSSVLAAFITYLTNNQQIIGLDNSFTKIASTQIWGITLPVFYMFGLAIILWHVLEHTPLGRRLYATGGNAEAARLAGVQTDRLVLVALVACALIASMAGIVATARIGAGAPDSGPSYLLPAFAAAFLGSTQFKGGRFNVWGTVVAVYVLATGVKGLELAGAPFWLPDLFNGVALLLAVGLAGYEGRTRLRTKTKNGEDRYSPPETDVGRPSGERSVDRPARSHSVHRASAGSPGPDSQPFQADEGGQLA